jgi:hypothetical protein
MNNLNNKSEKKVTYFLGCDHAYNWGKPFNGFLKGILKKKTSLPPPQQPRSMPIQVQQRSVPPQQQSLSYVQSYFYNPPKNTLQAAPVPMHNTTIHENNISMVSASDFSILNITMADMADSTMVSASDFSILNITMADMADSTVYMDISNCA